MVPGASGSGTARGRATREIRGQSQVLVTALDLRGRYEGRPKTDFEIFGWVGWRKCMNVSEIPWSTVTFGAWTFEMSRSAEHYRLSQSG